MREFTLRPERFCARADDAATRSVTERRAPAAATRVRMRTSPRVAATASAVRRLRGETSCAGVLTFVLGVVIGQWLAFGARAVAGRSATPGRQRACAATATTWRRCGSGARPSALQPDNATLPLPARHRARPARPAALGRRRVPDDACCLEPAADLARQTRSTDSPEPRPAQAASRRRGTIDRAARARAGRLDRPRPRQRHHRRPLPARHRLQRHRACRRRSRAELLASRPPRRTTVELQTLGGRTSGAVGRRWPRCGSATPSCGTPRWSLHDPGPGHRRHPRQHVPEPLPRDASTPTAASSTLRLRSPAISGSSAALPAACGRELEYRATRRAPSGLLAMGGIMVNAPTASHSLTVRLRDPQQARHARQGHVGHRQGAAATSAPSTSSRSARAPSPATSPSRRSDERARPADRRAPPRGRRRHGRATSPTARSSCTSAARSRSTARSPVKTRDDLSMAYTPGVARVCMAIHHDPEKAYTLTIKQNTVAVVTDGTAVLGLGDIGPSGAQPVMEGKALIFKEFAGVDAFPICLATKDVDEIVMIVKAIAPVFGGINLEDISAPALLRDRGAAAARPRHPRLPRRPARHRGGGAGRDAQRAQGREEEAVRRAHRLHGRRRLRHRHRQAPHEGRRQAHHRLRPGRRHLQGPHREHELDEGVVRRAHEPAPHPRHARARRWWAPTSSSGSPAPASSRSRTSRR